MIFEYKILIYYLCFIISVILLLFILSSYSMVQIPEPEKLSSYECGFNPFGDARNKFELRFYLIGILFLIFDLEIVFLFPLAIISSDINLNGLFGALSFISILTIGFLYE